eukprot:Hpha_TRINITY_DN33486_c0_g1::TRINITY_DN33486_c0_g1_i1::g.770::m.770
MGDLRKVLGTMRVVLPRRAPRPKRPKQPLPNRSFLGYAINPHADLPLYMNRRELHDQTAGLLTTWSIVFALMLSLSGGALFSQTTDGEKKQDIRRRAMHMLLGISSFVNLLGLALCSSTLCWLALIPARSCVTGLLLKRVNFHLAITGHSTLIGGGALGGALATQFHLLVDPDWGKEDELMPWDKVAYAGYGLYAGSGVFCMVNLYESARALFLARSQL